jgi:hypothetical protein
MATDPRQQLPTLATPNPNSVIKQPKKKKIVNLDPKPGGGEED